MTAVSSVIADAGSVWPIDRHGLVGDLRATALVSADATVVSMCLPDADSPSVFAAILDAERGGHLRCDLVDVPAGHVVRHRQHYLPGTNILISRLQADRSIVEVVDYMVPRHLAGGREGVFVRQIQALHGPRTVRLSCWPGFDYARASHTASASDGGRTVIFDAADAGALTVTCSHPLGLGDRTRGPEAVAEVELAADDTVSMIMQWGRNDSDTAAPIGMISDWTAATVAYWQSWLESCTYRGRWRDAVERSALCLKLLQHEPTGGIIAAPTFGLPEWPGGNRNWDYRYVWLRDAAFVVFALLRIGFVDEAFAFADWLSRRCAEAPDGDGLRPMYRLDGTAPPAEEVLDHLAGYAQSRPVLIGNAAYDQVQLDVLGEVMDSLYLYDRVQAISWELWRALGVQLDWLSEHWRDADSGLWESRGPRQQYVSSKVLVWVAFERAVRLARRRGLPGNLQRWQSEADAAYLWVQDEGWNDELGAYVQRAGSNDLDASALLIPMLRFASGSDPRVLSTLDRTAEQLTTDTLLFRYLDHSSDETQPAVDGIGGREGTFTVCTFWYVESLARAGRLQLARHVFEKTITYANELGLFAEQIGPSGKGLGNFPQALTHLALISAATTLDRRLP